jgi:pilus assembly protein Flp/PilA
MTNLMAIWQNFRNDESGQDLIEYALVAALIGLATVSAVSALAQNISDEFVSIGNYLESSV